ncbi:MAG: sulfotransferase [Pseudomonadota bacterium]
MRLPDKMLFIVGAPKCGTTSIGALMDEHPNVCLGKHKEPGFFRTDVSRWQDDRRSIPVDDDARPWRFHESSYEANFSHVENGQWGVDGSTDYLCDPEAPQRIAEARAGQTTKILIILRDPLERAFSQYRHLLHSGLETETFLDSLRHEDERIGQHLQPLFGHARRSRYYEGISRYRTLFRDGVLLVDFRDLSDTQAVLDRLCAFLSEEPFKPRSLESKNVSSEKGVPGMRRGWRRLHNRLAARPPLKPVAQMIESHFRRKYASHMRLDDKASRYFMAKVRDDVELCISDPGIPTDNWACTRYL